MGYIDQINALSSVKVSESLNGLKWMKKVFGKNGQSAFYALGDLDLDTDGAKDPGIKYESTHQDQTSIDPAGKWCNSNKINFFVLPGGFDKRHGGTEIGMLGTIFYNGKKAHAVFADFGPKAKWGEASIAVHRALGFERVKNGKIVDVGIDGNVYMLLYIGSKVDKIPCTQAIIDTECEHLLEMYLNG